MKFLLIPLFLLISGALHSQPSHPEQTAYDYFITEILIQEYREEKRVYYSGYTEEKIHFSGILLDCFESVDRFRELVSTFQNIESEKLLIQISSTSVNLKRSKRVKMGKLNLEVYRAIITGDQTYVYLTVYKPKHFVDHYLITISPESREVIDVCLKSEII